MSAPDFSILIVDDSPLDRAHVKSALLKGSASKFKFLEAPTCREGLAILQSEGTETLSCVVLDFDLPDGEATDFLQEIPRQQGLLKVPVLVLTGSGEEKNRVVLRAGAHEYLGKGWMTAASISRAVENAIDRQLMAQQAAEQHERLKESEEFSRAVLESSPDCLKVIDLDGQLLRINPIGLCLLELDSFDQVKLRSWESLWPEDERYLVRQAMEQARGGETGRFQAYCPTARGNLKWWDVIVSPIRRGDGRIHQLLAVSRDITAARRGEELLRESEKRFRNLADNSPVIMWVMEPNLACSYANKVWYEFTGQGSEAGLGSGWLQAVHTEDRDAIQKAFHQANRARQPFSAKARLRRKDGEFVWSLISASPRMADQIYLGLVSSVIDITDQKHLEHLVSERTAKLQETIGELESVSYSISHDMRQPLRSMQQFSQCLLEDYPDRLDDQGKGYLYKIIAGSNRLDRLIQDVLTYSRVSRNSQALDRIDLHQFIADIITQYPVFGADRVDIVFLEQLQPVRASDALLTQIVSNLLGNAVKFTPPERKCRIKLSTETRNEMVRLWIEDNGIGIAEGDLIKIWRIFEQVPNGLNQEGTGIGLSIVRKAAERMGGATGVESTLNQGSRFWVELPGS